MERIYAANCIEMSLIRWWSKLNDCQERLNVDNEDIMERTSICWWFCFQKKKSDFSSRIENSDRVISELYFESF